MKVLPLTSFPERFKALHHCRIEMEGGVAHPGQVRGARLAGRFVYLMLVDVVSLEGVAPLRGGLIQIPECERHPLAAGSFYQYEIIGLSVFTEEGTALGRVEQILETGGNDVYVVRGEGGREYCIPALASVVLDVDLARQRMVIRPLPGLLA